MFSKGTSSKFETQVHLGLLAIIFVLIALNFISNYITYNARITDKKVITGDLHNAAIAISRTLPELMPNPPDSAVDTFKRRFNLSGLILIPSQPENSSWEARRKWFTDFVYRLKTVQVPDVGRKILGSEYLTLTRGENDEYFYVYPVPSGNNKYLLILSMSSPELAYLDDSGEMVLAITVVSTLLIFFTYYMLVRYIFAPFRRLRQEALESGRVVMGQENEALAVAEDYRTAIAELKEKEQKLIELNKKISRRADTLEQFNNYLLQSTNSGIVTLDGKGRILSINDSAEKLLEIDSSEFVGSRADALFIIGSEIGLALSTVLKSRQSLPYREIEFVTVGGVQKSVGFSISTVSDEQQQPIGVSIFFTDLKEIISLRKELEGKNRLAALGEMSGGLAHQLRNSMGTIAGYCNLLKKEMTQKSESRGYFNDLFSEVKETESLVKRFLSFARPLEYQPEQVNLGVLVKEVVDGFKTNDRGRECTLNFNSRGSETGGALEYAADSLLLKQALSNILDNAVTACEEGKGIIDISIESTDLAITILVRDNGRGIPERDLDRVFTPFFSSKPSGTGLGLPLAAKIVDLHGGHITVESKAGAGTVFRIHFPVKESLAKVQPVSS